MSKGTYPDPPWDGTDEEWETYMASRPYRLQHPDAFAMMLICGAVIVAVICAAVSQALGGP